MLVSYKFKGYEALPSSHTRAAEWQMYSTKFVQLLNSKFRFTVCELLKMGVVALVSPPDPLIRQSVRMVAKQFQIPLIETHWDTDRSNSRFAINVHPAHDAFGQALFEYLSSYSKWNHVVLILADYGSKSSLYFFSDHTYVYIY